MHCLLEIIMPSVDDVEAAVKQILKPFDENDDGEDEDYCPKYSFWDFYIIGGRFSGAKLEAKLGRENINKFHKILEKEGITVSGMQCGKQALQPASQIPKVDALWNEHFPDSIAKVCPLFNHYNDQYKNSIGFPDVQPLKDVNLKMEVCHVIIAGESYLEDGTLEAKYMVQDTIWNGVSHVKSDWDGSLLSAIKKHNQGLKNAKSDYLKKMKPHDDWLVVTVDYHS